MIDPDTLTPGAVSRVLRRAYAGCPPWTRFTSRWRPYICPFHELVRHVPPGSRILDIGCGTGDLLVLLATLGLIRQGTGVDRSPSAIEIARRATLPAGCNVSFRTVSMDWWPEGPFDAVASVDVLHHVPGHHQRNFIDRLARVSRGGIVVFKDVSPRPRWKALGSVVHDALLRRHRIWIRDEGEVERWLREAGMEIVRVRRLDRLWYSHYLIVARWA